MKENRDGFEKAINACIENGRRLLEDSEYLKDYDRLPTAKAIAILAQEPVGRESVAHPAFSIISFPQRSSSVTVKKNVPPGTKARIFCCISQV